MSYAINIHFDTEAEFNAFIARLTGGARPLAPTQTTVTPTVKETTKPATKPASTTAAPTQPTAGAAAAPEEKASPSELDFDTDVKPAFLKYFAKDEAGARALVAAQGVKKLSELPKDKLPAVLALITAALG